MRAGAGVTLLHAVYAGWIIALMVWIDRRSHRSASNPSPLISKGTMFLLAGCLILTLVQTRKIGRPLLNHTGLSKLYDVDFRWDLNEHDPAKLAAALQRQLGLTLRAIPVDVLIVDRATELRAR